MAVHHLQSLHLMIGKMLHALVKSKILLMMQLLHLGGIMDIGLLR